MNDLTAPVVSYGPTLSTDVLALGVAGFVETFTKRVSNARGRLGRSEIDERDHRQRRLLRAGKRSWWS